MQLGVLVLRRLCLIFSGRGEPGVEELTLLGARDVGRRILDLLRITVTLVVAVLRQGRRRLDVIHFDVVVGHAARCPLADLKLRPLAYLHEDLCVEAVHDGQRQVEVQDARDDLEGRVGGVFGVADVLGHRAHPTVLEVVPADDRDEPERGNEPHQRYHDQSTLLGPLTHVPTTD